MDFNYPAFYEAEERLRQAGWFVINPARLAPGHAPMGLEREAQDAFAGNPANTRLYANLDIDVILKELRTENGDIIVTLEGWQDSIGAKAEIGVAEWVGLEVLPLNEAVLAGKIEQAEEIRSINEDAIEKSMLAADDMTFFAGVEGVYVSHIEPHHFHPSENPQVCWKCGGGPHGRIEVPTNGKDWMREEQSMDVDILKDKLIGEERLREIERATARLEPHLWTHSVRVETEEQREVLDIFTKQLAAVLADGGRKRAKGEKPSWKIDNSHLPAIFSHLNKYFHGERTDPDSGHHPFDHLACRALMISWQESQYGAGIEPTQTYVGAYGS